MKRIYLDQNKWIDIARFRAGIDEADKFGTVVGKLEAATDAGVVQLPLSGVHLLETAGIGREKRREDVAQVMFEFSKGMALRPFQVVFPLELESALRERFDGSDFSVRDRALALGAEGAMGGFSSSLFDGFTEAQQLILRHALATSPEFAVPLMTFSDEAYRAHARRIDEEAETQIAAVRARAQAQGATKSELLLHNQRDFFRNTYLPEVLRQLRALGAYDLTSWPEPRPGAPEFMMSLPTVDVWMTTVTERDGTWNRIVTANDIRDQAFLSVAVPYCDVVVTERYWGAAVERTGLAARHDCQVLRRLEDLEPILDEALSSTP